MKTMLAICVATVAFPLCVYAQTAPSAPSEPLLPFEAPPPAPAEERRPVRVAPLAASGPSEVTTDNATGPAGMVNLAAPGDPADFGLAGVVLMPYASWPNIAAQINGASSSNHFSVYAKPSATSTAVTSLLSVRGNGRVGIANPNPNGKLNVIANEYGLDALSLQKIIAYTSASAALSDTVSRAVVTGDIPAGVTNAGNLIATRSTAYLQGGGTISSLFGTHSETGIRPGLTGTISNAYGVSISVRADGGTITNGYGLFVGDVVATNAFGLYVTGTDDRSYIAGKLGIGTTTPTEALHIVGNIKATGDITITGAITGATVIGAVYQDLAEWVPASEDMVPGTVVVLDPTTNNQVMPSHRAYDTTVAGVVSAQPGLILGVGAATKEQIATTGRVKVKVDASRGAIAIGDILVTSDRSGMAMKSQPVELSGIAFHRPGTVIGKALEPLAAGEGEILVLLSLQ